MPGVELETTVRGGRVVVALLDLTGSDEVFSVQASVAAVRTARPGRAAPSRTGPG
jgi:hypothetical protein